MLQAFQSTVGEAEPTQSAGHTPPEQGKTIPPVTPFNHNQLDAKTEDHSVEEYYNNLINKGRQFLEQENVEVILCMFPAITTTVTVGN